MTETQALPARRPTAVDEVAERYMTRLCELSPEFAVAVGLPGKRGVLDGYSPEALQEATELDRSTLAELDGVQLADDVDRVTVAAMRERLGVGVELADAGERLRALDNIASPIQGLRDLFDNLPTATEEDWSDFASCLRDVPRALSEYATSLRLAASRGDVAARRQVRACIEQARDQAGAATSSYTTLIGQARLADGAELPEALKADLEEASAAARQGYEDVARMLEAEIEPRSGEADGVGRERYARFSREFLGAVVDLDETYEWGRERLAAIDAEQREIASRLYGPGTSVREALDRLNEDPARSIHGTKALQQWMQETSDAAITALDGTHFDIPAPLRTLECMIAPSATGGIYYTGPSDDFSRPGRMWWSVPEGTDTFAAWQERTTVFHEGVPGHHLQVGMQTYVRDELNSWRRLGCWVSGHGEGWALYAEKLMADLGFQDDPGDRMGMLDSQRLRAARVVLDIGVHLGKERPAELACLPGVGEGRWDYGSAWAFLRENVAMSEGFLRFELDRYLGWPGQAPSYAVGQRLWEQVRDEAVARGTSLKNFHMRALRLGSVGLDVLRQALAD
ncbi:DUF885 domain-containing protein [Actinomyces urogenitalis]|uniref:DUF885 domain-containing protein n=1 Tax=Actinomyces urogenitalis TaxID=103621 RepID=UPI0029053839|nr:DUF885 domain-containing protein [Actinomyces urogenitalis]MDU0864627.1 DUF885 domain-containing protein [Actinomyces urogenitalis]MDU0875173.1 DUF885 domain-containing protein [Actinomyces urogenitalis]MDU1564580.1 DUF885 domain-containing protein [Actinomyces urogenitalis]MDU1640145.1 DUF885 domain-containing protein [Actinomyces urogenitalis]MDU6777922.1 DUF885 domain-containing protein [Actinomyces urogenitalis]